jgi:BirA family biotin operon repressor/biotin-[acetyl-CoA-carboxylase] ligase
MSRNWVSQIGNLYFSLVLKPNKPIALASQISFIAAVAVGLAVEKFALSAKEKLSHKWPNDILFDGKKLAGILLESDEPQKMDGFVVLGIGININSHPTETSYPACNLAGQKIVIEDKINLLKEFLDNFASLYQKWLDFGFAPIRNLWLQKAFNLNKEISVNLPDKSLKGIFRDLDKEGNLVLEIDGKTILISSGEINFQQSEQR